MTAGAADPAALIASLGLQPHPEGGWYRETWREQGTGPRAQATAIYFLLEAHQRSHWHRVDAAELWLHHDGAPVALALAASEGASVETIRLGSDIAGGECPQGLVPAGWWQAAAPIGGWALLSCVVAPGFDFAGFELAPPGWTPAV